MADDNDFNTRVMAEFRQNKGKVGGFFEGRTLLILHTQGAKSNAPRVSPLICQQDGDRYFMMASNGGQAHHPAWYHNVLAHPSVSIEVGETMLKAVASVAAEPERTRLATLMEAYLPFFIDYRVKAGRVIPVVVLTPVI